MLVSLIKNDKIHTINLPNIKCNINDVYSRLYNNKVLLTSNEKTNFKKSKIRKSILL